LSVSSGFIRIPSSKYASALSSFFLAQQALTARRRVNGRPARVQLAVFLPSLQMFSHFVSPKYGALLGFLWAGARIIYGIGYSQAASKRELGSGLSFAVSSALFLGGLYGAVRAAFAVSK
jgi:hypothetical protein